MRIVLVGGLAAWLGGCLYGLVQTGAAAQKADPAPGEKSWVYRPPLRPPVPTVKNAAWVRNPIDAFVAVRLEEKGLHPSAEADRQTLIRRLSFDLIGLPPSPREIEDFLHDPAPDAYEKLVDRLLASPHYGERWALYWL